LYVVVREPEDAPDGEPDTHEPIDVNEAPVMGLMVVHVLPTLMTEVVAVPVQVAVE